MQSYDVNIDKKNVHIYEWGHSKKPTILCLHGLGGNGLSFAEVAGLLKKDFHVVAIDAPGHGRTSRFQDDEDYSPVNIAAWLLKVMTSLHIDSVSVMGHSWGGELALHFASRYSQLVRNVVLLDGGYIQPTDLPNAGLAKDLKNVEIYFEQYQFSSWEAYINEEKKDAKRWSPDIEAAAREKMKENEGQIELSVSMATIKTVFHAMYKQPTAKVFSSLQVPVLLLRSTLPPEMNVIRQKATDRLFKQVKEVSVVDMKHTTHDLYLDAPEKVSDVVMDWSN